MRCEVIEDRVAPWHWRVEAIDHEGDGEVRVAIFSGPEAQERAQEYAEWKRSAEPMAVARAS